MSDIRDVPFKLDLADFQSIEVAVELKNLTSGQKEIGPRDVHLLELSERGLLVSAERHFCATGQQLSVVLRVRSPRTSEECVLRATAKVLETEQGTLHTDSISMRLLQYRDEDWKRLQAVYSGRQSEISAFLKNVKGEE